MSVGCANGGWFTALAWRRSPIRGKRLPQVDERGRLVHLPASGGNQIADEQPADDPRGEEPPAGDNEAPVPANIDFLLDVELRSGRRPSFSLGHHQRATLPVGPATSYGEPARITGRDRRGTSASSRRR